MNATRLIAFDALRLQLEEYVPTAVINANLSEIFSLYRCAVYSVNDIGLYLVEKWSEQRRDRRNSP